MGFIDCMVGGDYTNLMLPNYSLVGFGFGGGNQLVPLIHLGFCAIPPLVLAHDALVISLSFGVVLRDTGVMEVTFRPRR